VDEIAELPWSASMTSCAAFDNVISARIEFWRGGFSSMTLL